MTGMTSSEPFETWPLCARVIIYSMLDPDVQASTFKHLDETNWSPWKTAKMHQRGLLEKRLLGLKQLVTDHIYIYIYVWYSVASPPPPQWSWVRQVPPPCGCGPVVGLWWFRVGLELS